MQAKACVPFKVFLTPGTKALAFKYDGVYLWVIHYIITVKKVCINL
mgnify:CR=1 FL=1